MFICCSVTSQVHRYFNLLARLADFGTWWFRLYPFKNLASLLYPSLEALTHPHNACSVYSAEPLRAVTNMLCENTLERSFSHSLGVPIALALPVSRREGTATLKDKPWSASTSSIYPTNRYKGHTRFKRRSGDENITQYHECEIVCVQFW